MPPKLLITGTSRVGGSAHPRLELATFVNNEKQFSLYIQALQQIFDRPQSEVASYFQIGGIHGRPFVEWNQSPPNKGRGYCVHGTSLFATWHRPYVVLVEQEIQKIALTIAKGYQVDQVDWVNAANSLRQPYWGWDAQSTLTPPDAVIANENVNIKVPPQAESKSLPNPFFQFKFPTDTDMAAMTPCPFHHHAEQVTTRNPNSQGKSDVATLKLILKGPIGSQIIQLTSDLSAVTTWAKFTKDLEDVHGLVHNVVGGFGNNRIPSGHMGWVPYAGFDPIFFAHHAQVDRLIQNWYTTHDQWETSQADLTPFWSSQIVYWKSNEIVDPDAVFNYKYSTAAVNSSTSSSDLWSAHISAKKFELRGSYTVFVFLGAVPADSRQWLTDPHFAGIFSVFANSTPEECANCRDQADLVVDSFVYLDDALKAAGLNSRLEVKEVTSFLKAEVDSERVNLNWGVSTADGRILRSEDLAVHFPSLKTVIVQSNVSRGPIHDKYTSFPDVTRGRPGGYRDDLL